MNALKFLTKFYTKLHKYNGIPFWALTPVRRVVRKVSDKLLPVYLKRTHLTSSNVASGVIVSFTSFPGRIDVVWMVVETLKRQSLRPEKIILWLSKKQFPTPEDIPELLWKKEDETFSIRLVDDDIRSHKKFYYAMKEFPTKSIVTCDDDVYYHPDTIKHLVSTSKLFPGCIIANVSTEIQWDKSGNLLPYLDWKKEYKKYANKNRIQIGVGGVLYPPYCLKEITLQSEFFLKLAPMADDLWLGSMARLSDTRVVQSDFNYHALDIKTTAPSLGSVNNGREKLNDKQLSDIRNFLLGEGYPDIYDVNYQT